jgi:hypothetical protein
LGAEDQRFKSFNPDHFMLEPFEKEMLENIRRTADRGLIMAQSDQETFYADLFQHILDEIERFKSEKIHG